MARRLGHGQTLTIEQFDRARESVVERVADVPFAFAAAQPVDLKDFDFLFPDLQDDPNNLLPVDPALNRPRLRRKPLPRAWPSCGNAMIGPPKPAPI